MNGLKSQISPRRKYITDVPLTKELPEIPLMTQLSAQQQEWDRVRWLSDFKQHSQVLYTSVLPFSNINYYTTQNIICSDMHLQHIIQNPTKLNGLRTQQTSPQNLRQSPTTISTSQTPRCENKVKKKPFTKKLTMVLNTEIHSPRVEKLQLNAQKLSSKKSTKDSFKDVKQQRQNYLPETQTQLIIPEAQKLDQQLNYPTPIKPEDSDVNETPIKQSALPSLKSDRSIRLFDIPEKVVKSVKFLRFETDNQPEPVQEEKEDFPSDQLIQSGDQMDLTTSAIPPQSQMAIIEKIQCTAELPRASRLTRVLVLNMKHLSIYDLITSSQFQDKIGKKVSQNLVLGKKVEINKNLVKITKTRFRNLKQFKYLEENQFDQTSQTFSRKMRQILSGLQHEASKTTKESNRNKVPIPTQTETRTSPRNQGLLQPVLNSTKIRLNISVIDTRGVRKINFFTPPPYFKYENSKFPKRKPKSMLIEAINKAFRLNNGKNEAQDRKLSIFTISGIQNQVPQNPAVNTTVDCEMVVSIQYSFLKVKRFYKLYIQQKFIQIHERFQHHLQQLKKQPPKNRIFDSSNLQGFKIKNFVNCRTQEDITLIKFDIDHTFQGIVEQYEDAPDFEEAKSIQSGSTGQNENLQELLEDDDEFRNILEKMQKRHGRKKLTTQVETKVRQQRLYRTQSMRFEELIQLDLPGTLIAKRREPILENKVQMFVQDLYVFRNQKGFRFVDGNHLVILRESLGLVYVQEQRETILLFIFSNLDKETRNHMLSFGDLRHKTISLNDYKITDYDLVDNLAMEQDVVHFNARNIEKRYEHIMMGEYEDYLEVPNKIESLEPIQQEKILTQEIKTSVSKQKLLMSSKMRSRTERNLFKGLGSQATSVDLSESKQNIQTSNTGSNSNSTLLTLQLQRQPSSRNLSFNKTAKSFRNLLTINQIEEKYEGEVLLVPNIDTVGNRSPSNRSYRSNVSGQQQLSHGGMERPVSMLKDSLLMRSNMKEANKKKNMTPQETATLLITNGKITELQEYLTQSPNLPINSVVDSQGNSFLIVAAQSGFLEGVKLLLKVGANINQANNDGDTALHKALAYQNFRVADCLIANGAATNIRNNLGFNPWTQQN